MPPARAGVPPAWAPGWRPWPASGRRPTPLGDTSSRSPGRDSGSRRRSGRSPGRSRRRPGRRRRPGPRGCRRSGPRGCGGLDGLAAVLADQVGHRAGHPGLEAGHPEPAEAGRGWCGLAHRGLGPPARTIPARARIPARVPTNRTGEGQSSWLDPFLHPRSTSLTGPAGLRQSPQSRFRRAQERPPDRHATCSSRPGPIPAKGSCSGGPRGPSAWMGQGDLCDGNSRILHARDRGRRLGRASPRSVA